MEDTPYRRSIFRPPGQSDFLTRGVFYAYGHALRRFLGPGEGSALGRATLLLGAMLVALGALIAATPADFYLVWFYEDYEQPSIVYALDENNAYVPIAEYYQHARRVIKLPESGPAGLDSRVVRCFIATEDTDFYSHPGVDLKGILRAALVNLMAGEVREGASTITQQVARLRFLSNDRSLVRKLREAFLAVLFELRYSKREIMETYLNTVPLGMGTNGVEAAAQFYFGKTYDQLSWGEAAVLSSMTTRPEDFSPFKSPGESQRKVRIVFQKLVEQGMLSPAEAEAEFLRLEREFYAVIDRSPNDSAFNQRLNAHPYVTEYVRLLMRRRLGNRLYRGGYKIYTTIRIPHQKAAEDAMIPYLQAESERRKRAPFKQFDAFDDEFSAAVQMSYTLYDLPEFKIRMSRDERRLMRAYESEMQTEFEMLGGFFSDSNVQKSLEAYRSLGQQAIEEVQTVEGALISLRPFTGEITAVVGGSGFASRNQQLRFINARRQPGSAFKPIIYGAALEYGGRNPGPRALTASTLVDDSPVTFVAADLSEYSPENYSGSYDGLMRLRKALILSKNAVAVRVYEQVGPGAINPIAEQILKMDQETPRRRLPREAAVALGSYAVTPFEMAEAYAVFASNGRETTPYIISHVEDARGELVIDNRDDHREAGRQIVSPGVAEIVTSMLQDAVSKGTGTAAQLGGRPVAGKTGTTNRGTNAWFVGYTPELVTAVYIGYDTPLSLGGGATGGGLAAPVWGRYMQRALRSEPSKGFSFPGSNVVRVEICETTGMLPGGACPERMTEIFLPGTQPRSVGDESYGGSGSDTPGMAPPLRRSEDEIFNEDELR